MTTADGDIQLHVSFICVFGQVAMIPIEKVGGWFPLVNKLSLKETFKVPLFAIDTCEQLGDAEGVRQSIYTLEYTVR